MASDEDIAQDLWHLAKARQLAPLLPASAADLDCSQILHPAEKNRLREYLKKFATLSLGKKCSWSDLVVHLGDNPAGGVDDMECDLRTIAGVPPIRRYILPAGLLATSPLEGNVFVHGLLDF